MNSLSKSLLTFSAIVTAFVSYDAQGAAIVSISFTSASKTFVDNLGNPLSGGTQGVNGDGAVLQLGYFSTATTSSLFSGTWVPLTGNGGLNSAFNTTSVGDGVNSGANNRAIFTLTFDMTDSTKNQGLPAAGVPLGIRVYNGLTVAGSTLFETVVSPDWAFVPAAEPPSNPTIALSFANANAKLASSGALVSASSTVATVTPEPGTLGLLCIGLVGLASRRRRVA